MNKTKLLELINQRFEETDLEFLNMKNSLNYLLISLKMIFQL